MAAVVGRFSDPKITFTLSTRVNICGAQAPTGALLAPFLSVCFCDVSTGIPDMPYPRESRHVVSIVLLCALAASAQNFGSISGINGTLVKCHTTALNGKAFVLEIKAEWAPEGAQRFLELVESGFFTDVAFFRVVPDFLTQFGITPDRDLRKYWRDKGTIPDDPSQGRAFKKGMLSFAGGGPDTRDTQLFIALADSDWLGKAAWEVPLGRVIDGMDVLDALYDKYGDIHPFDKGPDQALIWSEGNEYLQRDFPLLDYFKDCAIIPSSVKEPVPDPPASEVEAQPQLARAAEPEEGMGSAAITRQRAHEVVVDNLPARPPPSPSMMVFVVSCIVASLYFLTRVLRSPKTDKASL